MPSTGNASGFKAGLLAMWVKVDKLDSLYHLYYKFCEFIIISCHQL
jgi:hypothetical protein